MLWGVFQAFAGWVSRKQFTFKVTPKRVTRPRRLPLVALLPYPALALACSVAAIIMSDPGSARGYYWFCLSNALIYSVVTAAVVMLHVRENRAQLTMPLYKFAGVQLAATAAVAPAVAAAFVLRGGDVLQGANCQRGARLGYGGSRLVYAGSCGDECARGIARADPGRARSRDDDVGSGAARAGATSAEACQRGLLGATRRIADRASGLGRIRIAVRLAQLPLDAPLRGQRQHPEPLRPLLNPILNPITPLRR